MPGRPDPRSEGQAFAWNPSITGCKSEDTILVGRDRNEVMTEIAGWPAVEATVDGTVWTRPAVLEIT